LEHGVAAGCTLPSWAAPPGGIKLTYQPDASDQSVRGAPVAGGGTLRGLSLAWNLCSTGNDAAVRGGIAAGGPAASRLAGMADGRVALDSIWQPSSNGGFLPQGSLLAPAAALVGVRASRLAILALAAGAAFSLFASWWMARAGGAPPVSSIEPAGPTSRALVV